MGAAKNIFYVVLVAFISSMIGFAKPAFAIDYNPNAGSVTQNGTHNSPTTVVTYTTTDANGNGLPESITFQTDSGPQTYQLSTGKFAASGANAAPEFQLTVNGVSVSVVVATGTSGRDIADLNSVTHPIIFFGGPGQDSFTGGAHGDSAHGGSGSDTLDGGGGSDELGGDSGNDTLNGGDSDDIIDGGSGDDTMHGGNGDDDLDGETGDDTMYGQDGDDVITDNGGSPDTDVVDGGGQSGDVADVLDGDTNDTVTGTANATVDDPSEIG